MMLSQLLLPGREGIVGLRQDLQVGRQAITVYVYDMMHDPQSAGRRGGKGRVIRESRYRTGCNPVRRNR